MNTEDKEFEKSRQTARSFGGSVYVGGVIAATMLFITFVLTAFPQDAYFSRVIMTIAGLAVGASMLAFPIALHNWTIEKKHRQITTWLYYAEMLFIGVNTVVSFVNLLAQVTGYAAPEWAVLYEPFSVVSIIYVIFAWGTIFLTDPEARNRQKQREYEQTRRTIIEDVKLEYLKAPEGRADIARQAQLEIAEHARNAQNKSFFQEPSAPSWIIKESTVEQPKSGDSFRAG